MSIFNNVNKYLIRFVKMNLSTNGSCKIIIIVIQQIIVSNRRNTIIVIILFIIDPFNKTQPFSTVALIRIISGPFLLINSLDLGEFKYISPTCQLKALTTGSYQMYLSYSCTEMHGNRHSFMIYIHGNVYFLNSAISCSTRLLEIQVQKHLLQSTMQYHQIAIAC